jgi:hypothetical protein
MYEVDQDYDCGCNFMENEDGGGGWTKCPLHAAAPDLLVALEGMLEWARRVTQRNPGMEVANAMNAITKATST